MLGVVFAVLTINSKAKLPYSKPRLNRHYKMFYIKLQIKQNIYLYNLFLKLVIKDSFNLYLKILQLRVNCGTRKLRVPYFKSHLLFSGKFSHFPFLSTATPPLDE